MKKIINKKFDLKNSTLKDLDNYLIDILENREDAVFKTSEIGQILFKHLIYPKHISNFEIEIKDSKKESSTEYVSFQASNGKKFILEIDTHLNTNDTSIYLKD